MQFKKTFKSLTAIIIVLAMMFSLLPVSVMAEDENAAPTSIEIGHNADMIDEKVVAKKVTNSS